jgi:hypothetical protein
MVLNLACDSDSHVNHRVLLHAANLRYGTDGFTFPPKEGMLWIFFARKIRWLQPDSNPWSWVPETSMVTTRPPKRLCVIGEFREMYRKPCSSQYHVAYLLQIKRIFQREIVAGAWVKLSVQAFSFLNECHFYLHAHPFVALRYKLNFILPWLMVLRRVWSSSGTLIMHCYQYGADWFLSLCGTIFSSRDRC